MKKLSIILSLIICTVSNTVYATNFYISTSKGNDGNSGTSKAAPWATINKLNTMWASINPGDSILFEKGNTYSGTILVAKSGTSGNPIVIGSYGTGTTPLLSGYQVMSGFTSASAGVYQVTFSAGKQNFINLEFDGVMQRFGRTPNAGVALPRYESYANKSTFTDNEMPVIPGIDSAEVGVRKARWAWERGKVTSKVGNTITYGLTGNNVNGSAGTFFNFYGVNFGWFVQNSLQTLDKTGEFFFKPSTKVLYIFSSDPITNHTVRASAIDRLININGNSYVTVENLAFEGANISAIYSVNGSNVQIKNNVVHNSGAIGIQLTNVSTLLVDRNQVDWSLSTGIQANGGNAITVTRNIVTNTYPYEAMGDYGSDDNCLRGMALVGNNMLVQYNTVRKSGFSGIKWQGNNVVIKNNVIDTFTLVQDDNAGLYSYVGDESNYGPPKTTFSNRLLTENIILNGASATYGASNNGLSSGIYSDGKNNNITSTYNFIANMPYNGIVANNPSALVARGNTFYNVATGIKYNTYRKGIAGSFLADSNIFIHADNSQYNVTYNTDTLRYGTIAAEIFATIDFNNSFTYQLNQTPFGVVAPAPPYAPFSFTAWNAFTGKEGKSRLLKSFAPYTVSPGSTVNRFPNPFLTTNIAGITTFSATGAWDNTNQITNGTYRMTFTTTTPQSYGVAFASVGVVSGKYLFRFKTKGTSSNGIIQVYAGLTANPTLAQIPRQRAIYGTAIKQHEFLLDLPNINGTVNIELDRSGGTTYIDDIEFYPVTATYNDLTDSIRVEYAASDTNFVSLAFKYRDPFGKVYNGGTDTILPYHSKIYLYEGVVDAPVNQAPIVDAGTAQTIKLPVSSTTLTATASDPDGTISKTIWTKISGGSVTIYSPNQLTTQVDLSTIGTYLFQVSVSDNSGDITTDTVTVILLAANIPPVISAGADQSIQLPVSSVVLSATASDFDGTISSLLWSKISGPACTISNPSSNVTAVTAMTTIGTYLFKVTATDNEGATNSDTVQVTVIQANVPPLVNAGTDKSITLPISSSTLNGSAVDIDGTVSSYYWTQISGPVIATIVSPLSAVTPVTDMTTAGTYLFRLHVTDNQGASMDDDIIITVNNPIVPPVNTPPVVVIAPNISIRQPRDTVTVSAVATDNDGSISAYRWTKVSGPSSYGIVSPNSAVTKISNLVSGTYVFSLRATDNLGLSTTKYITVYVLKSKVTQVKALIKFENLIQ